MFSIGSSTVEKIHEMDFDGMKLEELLPAMGAHFAGQHPDLIPDGTLDDAGNASMSIHYWLVRHEGMTVLIDTDAGNGKSRPQEGSLGNLNNPFLKRLYAVGVGVGDVDFDIHTHLLLDRVGWNTVMVDGEWRPCD